MNDQQKPIPDDDPARKAVQISADDDGARHLAVVGDTYTILVSGSDTAGRYTLIDMLVPQGGGPPPHRHDFEEMFTVLEGEIEVTFRGETTTVRAGETVNVPANAPHRFTNAAASPARLLCMCTPAGQEEFFARDRRPGSHPHLAGSRARSRHQSRADEKGARTRAEVPDRTVAPVGGGGDRSLLTPAPAGESFALRVPRGERGDSMSTVTVGQENSTPIEIYYEDHGSGRSGRAAERLATRQPLLGAAAAAAAAGREPRHPARPPRLRAVEPADRGL